MPDDLVDPVDGEEAEALRRLRQPFEPSAAHGNAVRESLRRRGAFRTRVAGWWIPLAMAASLMIGLLAGRQWPDRPDTTGAGDEYVIVLLNRPAPAWPAGTTADQVVSAYRDWSRRLAREGRLMVAEELDSTRILVDDSGVRNGDIATALGGLFVVRAANDSAAVALAASLPHVRQGGTVSVQRVIAR